MNLVAAIRTHAERRPDAPALIEGRETVDWSTLQARVEAVAWRLHEQGIGQGDVVALAVRRSIPHVVLTLAIGRLGAAWCALDWRMPPAQHAGMLTAIGPRCLLLDRPAPATGSVPVLVVNPDWYALPANATAPPATGGDDLPAILLQSSGTTGQPKVLCLTRRAAIWRARYRAQAFGLQTGMRVLHAMPHWTAAPIKGIYGQLRVGATGVFHPLVSSTDELIEGLGSQRIDQVSLPPTTIRDLTARAPGPGMLLPRLQAMISAGSVLHDWEKKAAMEKVTPNLWEDYGSAGSGPIALASPEDLRRRPTTVGRAPADVDLQIVDDHDLPAANGTLGRIRVRSPAVSFAQIGGGPDHAGAEGVRDGYVYTGDLGWLDPEGFLFLEGRTGTMIIRGGQNISVEEIERVLLMCPGVKEAAVVGLADPRLGEVPVALIVPATALVAADLRRFSRQHLAPAKLPTAFVLVDALPRTATGKIQRRDLAALLERAQGQP